MGQRQIRRLPGFQPLRRPLFEERLVSSLAAQNHLETVELNDTAEHEERNVEEQGSNVGRLGRIGASRLPVGLIEADQLGGKGPQLARPGGRI